MNMKYRKRVNYYTVGDAASKSAFVAGYRRDLHVPEPMQRFIALCREQAFTEWETETGNTKDKTGEEKRRSPQADWKRI